MDICLNWGIIAVVKHHDQKQLREEMVHFSLQLVVYHPQKS